MILKRGCMWNTPADVYVVTGNSTVKKDGCLVMGRGAAREARNKFSGIDKVFGDEIKKAGRLYGFIEPLVERPVLSPRVCLFQVKHHWRLPASPRLIQLATTKMLLWLEALELETEVSMNFPGIGNGGLLRADVLPIIQVLPDNVTVWEYGKGSGPR